ncbi:MFS transporter [Actinomadura sp. 3N407]|uniref:MFS transporter n=1 Tax=Actinomadura sp. 3N407 TaxID=3457423 RepID=UPI003FCDEFD1
MIAGFLVAMGTLGDRIGRRRLLVLGAGAFAVASVAAAYAPSAGTLIVARALLGIAGATLMPSTLALISNMFRDPGQRGTAIGVWAACLSGGVALGPAAGGTLLESFWWGSVFLIAVPVMGVLLVTAPVLLPEYRAAAPGRVDVTSVVLSIAAMLAIVYGVKRIAHGSGVLTGLVIVLAGVAAGTVFCRRQRGLDDPLIELRLFRHRIFGAALVVLFLALAVGSAPPEKAGSASAISETSTELGLAFGVATLGSVGTLVYRRADPVPASAGVPPDMAEAARGTIEGATTAAAQLPPQQAAELLETAQQAFTDGLNAIAGISAAVTLALAVLAVTALRRPPSTEADTTAADAPPQAESVH